MNTYKQKNNGLMDDEDTDEEDKYGEDTDDDYKGLVWLWICMVLS